MKTYRKPAIALAVVAFAIRLRASFLTYIRGIALPNEKPLLVIRPSHVIAHAIVRLILSLTGTALILGSQQPWLWPLLVLPVIAGQSSIWMFYMISHQAIHDAISQQNKWLNRWVAELASTIALTLPQALYWKSHISGHHVKSRLATNQDPDFRWLQRWGFIPGQPVAYYWRQLIKTLLNPKYYWVFFSKRVEANFIKAAPYRKAIAILWWSMVFAITVLTHGWLVVMLGYVLPVILGYPVSSFLQTISEHRWGEADLSRKTFPRLLPIDHAPWWKALLYFYWKSTVLVLDLGLHDQHHKIAQNYNWPMIAYSQEGLEDISIGVYGIRNHFREAFKSLANASAD